VEACDAEPYACQHRRVASSTPTVARAANKAVSMVNMKGRMIARCRTLQRPNYAHQMAGAKAEAPTSPAVRPPTAPRSRACP
jgi:hypothetical protein